MDKKEYITPELTLLGDVEELTKGQGFRGSDDQFFFMSSFSNRGGYNDLTSG